VHKCVMKQHQAACDAEGSKWVKGSTAFENLFKRFSDEYDEFNITSGQGFNVVSEANVPYFVYHTGDDQVEDLLLCDNEGNSGDTKTIRTITAEITRYGIWYTSDTYEGDVLVHDHRVLSEPTDSAADADARFNGVVTSLEADSNETYGQRNDYLEQQEIRLRNADCVRIRGACLASRAPNPQNPTARMEVDFDKVVPPPVPPEGDNEAKRQARAAKRMALETAKVNVSNLKAQLEEVQECASKYAADHGLVTNFNVQKLHGVLINNQVVAEKNYNDHHRVFEDKKNIRSALVDVKDKELAELDPQKKAEATNNRNEANQKVEDIDAINVSYRDSDWQESLNAATKERDRLKPEMDFWTNLDDMFQKMMKCKAALKKTEVELADFHQYKQNLWDKPVLDADIKAAERELKKLKAEIGDDI